MGVSFKHQAASAKLQATSHKLATIWWYKTGERIIMEKIKNGVLGDVWKQRYLREINDELLELYNTPGMALHFQPSKLKILKEQIEKLIKLEDYI